jgi:hypothetical protein
MEFAKFVALSLGGAAISTAILVALARPVAYLTRRLLFSRRERTRTYTVPVAH